MTPHEDNDAGSMRIRDGDRGSRGSRGLEEGSLLTGLMHMR